jgi:predicted transcriptional regulator
MPSTVKDSQVSLRLPADLKEKLEVYAELTGRTKSYVAMEALSTYLDGRMPQIDDLKLAVAAADEGDFASDDEVAAVFARHTADKTPRARASTARRRRA